VAVGGQRRPGRRTGSWRRAWVPGIKRGHTRAVVIETAACSSQPATTTVDRLRSVTDLPFGPESKPTRCVPHPCTNSADLAPSCASPPGISSSPSPVDRRPAPQTISRHAKWVPVQRLRRSPRNGHEGEVLLRHIEGLKCLLLYRRTPCQLLQKRLAGMVEFDPAA